MPPTPTSEEEYKQWIVLITGALPQEMGTSCTACVCFMIVIAGFVLGWFVSVLWTALSLALFLLIYVWAFFIKWRTRK